MPRERREPVDQQWVVTVRYHPSVRRASFQVTAPDATTASQRARQQLRSGEVKFHELNWRSKTLTPDIDELGRSAQVTHIDDVEDEDGE